MFASKQEGINWITQAANSKLKKQLARLTEQELNTLYEIFESNSDLQGNYELINVMQSLGAAVFSLMQLAKNIKCFRVGSSKKHFVLESALLLSRLIDNGKSGRQDNVNKDVEGFEFLSDHKDSFQQMFVRPQVDKAIEESYPMWKETESEQQLLEKEIRNVEQAVQKSLSSEETRG